jgi:glycine/D-amino acid oxidase-like deaminating enzyme
MSNAIVIGGSISGLVSARVLLNHFDSVALIERDQLPDYPAVRPGVPQASHVHGLLLKGHQLLEQFFPDLTQDLLARGAQLLDWGRDWQWLTAWG